MSFLVAFSANGLKYHKEKTKCEITIDVTSVSHHSAGHTVIATTSREEIYPGIKHSTFEEKIYWDHNL